jgi:enamine deaminase RidA (YjgF/YER057c/UK114 family)
VTREDSILQRRSINPWRWQDGFGFVQANDVRDPRRVILCAGQFSGDGEGRPLCPGDMHAQITQALDNLEAVLREAGLTLASVVRLNYYTTDVDRFLAANEVLVQRLADAHWWPASTLFGLARLAFPELLMEIEATALA